MGSYQSRHKSSAESIGAKSPRCSSASTSAEALVQSPSSPKANRTAASPGHPLSWKEHVLEACSIGDIETLESLLAQRDEKLDPENDRLIAEMMGRATSSNQAETLAYLLAQYPEFPEQQYELSIVHGSLFRVDGAVLPVYKTLIARYPFLQEWNFGELADHLGAAAFRNDLEWASYLLSHGADASRARWFHIPVLKILSNKGPRYKEFSAMRKLLKKNGATEDGVIEY